ncbi:MULTISPECIES: hypothetical protein [Streptomyces]|uniref:hypothetical protein n=1 Tax=Streptomyces TaxID=1883 RepID=UPI001672F93A|nr:hypothetical protein [Streptomyces thermoviolaceus]WTD46060.1 hypothetical protein OG899_00135 [Streptomyces thermoviolaceus]GGV80696.1 hypothetical protein GCM10010499_43920 [Streptomyces thermoviolaceus subsp. apingens]GHA74200.1 hypothetical protein GCM10010512_00390 [Streptomyces thermoviolaceus subsp. thermoviolaceus]
MGLSTPRHGRAKQPSGCSAQSKRKGRNEKFRYVNRFGKRAVGTAFLIVPFTGYLLVCRPPVHVTLSPEAVSALGGVLSAAVFGQLRTRRHRH